QSLEPGLEIFARLHVVLREHAPLRAAPRRCLERSAEVRRQPAPIVDDARPATEPPPIRRARRVRHHHPGPIHSRLHHCSLSFAAFLRRTGTLFSQSWVKICRTCSLHVASSSPWLANRLAKRAIASVGVVASRCAR